MKYSFLFLFTMILFTVVRVDGQTIYLNKDGSAIIESPSGNNFYIGVSHHLEVINEGSDDGVTISCDTNFLQVYKWNKTSKGQIFIIRAIAPTDSTALKFTLNGRPYYQSIALKYIPDPHAIIATPPPATYKYPKGWCGTSYQPGIIAMLRDFNYEARCNIQEFKITRITKNGHRISAKNRGGR